MTSPITTLWKKVGNFIWDKYNKFKIEITTGDVTTVGDYNGVDLTLSGDIDIPDQQNAADALKGIIYKDGVSFINNFRHPTGNTARPDGHNLNLGIDAGNLTMGSTATETYHGSFNLNIGYQAGYALTTGNKNFNMGYLAGYALTTGNRNFNMGYQAGYTLTTGYNNFNMGYLAGYALTTGNSNLDRKSVV